MTSTPEPEFPPELVEKCALASVQAVALSSAATDADVIVLGVLAVLRASGFAEARELKIAADEGSRVGYAAALKEAAKIVQKEITEHKAVLSKLRTCSATDRQYLLGRIDECKEIAVAIAALAGAPPAPDPRDAEIARLRSALEPFAAVGRIGEVGSHFDGSESTLVVYGSVEFLNQLRIMDWRNAIAALAKAPSAPDPDRAFPAFDYRGDGGSSAGCGPR